ncbi:MAG TPA: hypothetical protein VIO64_09730 [Pseudobacteroides sp.]
MNTSLNSQIPGFKADGTCTISALKKAVKEARPDHQHRYKEIINCMQT